jgi:hypothetical protein
MSLFLRKNFARGSLAAQLLVGSTQLTLHFGHTLPITTGSMRLCIWNIVVYNNPAEDLNAEFVTASYSGTPNLYNIIRAQEGTIAVAHSIGDEVALHFTAGLSSDDLTWLGTKQVDETGIANEKVLSYNGTKLVYVNPVQSNYILEFGALLITG